MIEEKRLIYVVGLIAVIIFLCAVTNTKKHEPISKGFEGQILKNISALEAKTLIADNQGKSDFYTLDIRTQKEYDQGHIKDSILIDFYKFDFKDKLNALEKEHTYFIYCRSGRRTGIALEMMGEIGFESVYNLKDGIIGWKRNNLPLEH